MPANLDGKTIEPVSVETAPGIVELERLLKKEIK